MLADAVRAHRRRLGLTQEELAARSGVSVRTIRAIEAGRIERPRPATLRLLADSFGLGGGEREEFHARAPAGTPSRAARSTLPVPAQLPADVAGFTGRAETLKTLDDLSTDGGVVVVVGAPGIGKTALAVHWAHRSAHRFPDGQLYVNLRGFDPAGHRMAPAQALRGLIGALGVPPQDVPAEVDAQAALYRSLVARRRILVLLDNARDAGHVRPLLPGSSAALTVVTSRDRLTPLVVAVGARPLVLDLMSTIESRELVARRVGTDRAAAEPVAVEQIVTACARLPLALAIGAARARQSSLPLAATAAELTAAGQRLDALDAGDATSQVRAVFASSYATLNAPAARLFRLLGLHPGPDFSAAAAAALADRPLDQVAGYLAELVRANLLVEIRHDRYAVHDLLHLYAASLTGDHDSGDARRAALGRLLGHYAEAAYAADRLLHPQRDLSRIPFRAAPYPDTAPERPADAEAAMAWLATEHQALLAGARQAQRAGLHPLCWRLVWSLDTFLDRRGHWHDMAVVWRAALRAARDLRHPAAEAYAHRVLAYATGRLGDYRAADRHLRQALRLYVRTGDQIGRGDTHYVLGQTYARRGDVRQGLTHAEEALRLYRAAGGHARRQALALNAAGWYRARLGEYRRALGRCRQAYALFRRLGDRHGQAASLDSLGFALHHLGRHAQATGCYERAIALYRALGDRYYAADTLHHLGDNHRAAGDVEAARAAWRDALDVLSELDHADAESVRAKLAALP